MKILAIESSALTASVALADENLVIAEYTTNYKKTHSQTLMPMTEEIFRMTETKPDDLDAVAVCKGPGSFTGLRIGAATAKGLGLALDIPLIPVPTLEAMAYNFYGSQSLIVPLMDARRDQVYTGVYKFVAKNERNSVLVQEAQDERSCEVPGKEQANEISYELETVIEAAPMSIAELVESLNDIFETAMKNKNGGALNDTAGSRPEPDRNADISKGEASRKAVMFLGDGVPVFKNIIVENAKFPYAFAPLSHNRQSAASLAAAAVDRYKQGKSMNAADFAPDYFRLSQAEREAKNKK